MRCFISVAVGFPQWRVSSFQLLFILLSSGRELGDPVSARTLASLALALSYVRRSYFAVLCYPYSGCVAGTDRAQHGLSGR